jgi:hypothetical protein
MPRIAATISPAGTGMAAAALRRAGTPSSDEDGGATVRSGRSEVRFLRRGPSRRGKEFPCQGSCSPTRLSMSTAG